MDKEYEIEQPDIIKKIKKLCNKVISEGKAEIAERNSTGKCDCEACKLARKIISLLKGGRDEKEYIR